jgi:hypothetical protein
MKLLSTVIFLAAFIGWAWLEFGASGTQEGIKDILFWVGMGAVLVNGWANRRHQAL